MKSYVYIMLYIISLADKHSKLPHSSAHQEGVVWPSEATLYLTPCSAHSVYSDKVTFWNDVYGFDFSPLM